MANVINRSTLQYLTSVHTPNYPVEDWIINPVLPSCEQKYWKISGDNVLEMNQSEKDIKDIEIADQQAQIEENAKDIDNLEKGLRVLAILTFKEINKLRENAGLAEYTWIQFKNAFKNEWNLL
ncbi:MAG: hypothetical protein ACFFG0_14170 [Candidatus Thorarchaeota archaeon]